MRTIELDPVGGDAEAVTRRIRVARNTGASTGADVIPGFGPLIAEQMANAAEELDRENDGLRRYSAVLADTVVYTPNEEEEEVEVEVVEEEEEAAEEDEVVEEGEVATEADAPVVKDEEEAAAEEEEKEEDGEEEVPPAEEKNTQTHRVEFTLPAEKHRNTYVDAACVVLDNDDDLKTLLRVCHADATVPSLLELASHTPSLFWSLHAAAKRSEPAHDDESTEEAMVRVAHVLLGVEQAAGKQRKRRRRGA